MLATYEIGTKDIILSANQAYFRVEDIRESIWPGESVWTIRYWDDRNRRWSPKAVTRTAPADGLWTVIDPDLASRLFPSD